MLKMMRIRLIFLIIASFASCTPKEAPTEERKILVYCDEAIYNLLLPCVKHYDSTGSVVKVTFRKTTAWDAMAKLLARETDAIIIARDYTFYEDSLMKAFGVFPHTRLTLAYDALVFYVAKDSPLDTLTHEQIKNYLTDKNYSLKRRYKQLPSEPIIAVNSPMSSELVNLNYLVLRGGKIERPVKIFQTHDSVKNYVKANPYAIGIGYLSHLFAEPELRALPVSFVDSTGKYVFPHNVNQPNILRELYPYIVKHYIYVLDKLNDNAMTFARYLYNPGFAQKFFFEHGIVPSNAEFRLIEEE